MRINTLELYNVHEVSQQLSLFLFVYYSCESVVSIIIHMSIYCFLIFFKTTTFSINAMCMPMSMQYTYTQ